MAREATTDIGSRRELSVDGHVVEATRRGVAHRPHSPTPREAVLVTDRPWEGASAGASPYSGTGSGCACTTTRGTLTWTAASRRTALQNGIRCGRAMPRAATAALDADPSPAWWRARDHVRTTLSGRALARSSTEWAAKRHSETRTPLAIRRSATRPAEGRARWDVMSQGTGWGV